MTGTIEHFIEIGSDDGGDILPIRNRALQHQLLLVRHARQGAPPDNGEHCKRQQKGNGNQAFFTEDQIIAVLFQELEYGVQGGGWLDEQRSGRRVAIRQC